MKSAFSALFLLLSGKIAKILLNLRFVYISIGLSHANPLICRLYGKSVGFVNGGANMNKTDLINKVAEATEMTKKDASKSVEAVLEAIAGALREGEKVQLIGFGNFEVKDKPERKGRNPRTGEEMIIPARKSVSFKAGKQLREEVNK
jgi:DNA-binding protein HU-beta